jgi:hypothetical protein
MSVSASPADLHLSKTQSEFTLIFLSCVQLVSPGHKLLQN